MKTKKQIHFSKNRLPNRARLLTYSFFCLGLSVLLMNVSACSTIRLQRAQFAEDKRANLPRNAKSAEEDADLAKESSCLISVDDDGGTFLIGKEKIFEAELAAKIAARMQDKSPDKRIVYIESAVGVKYETIVKLLHSMRKADIDKAGLVAFRGNYEKLGSKPSMLAVKLPLEPSLDELPIQKPNPLTLLVSIDKTGVLLLNREPTGNVNETEKLTNKLTEVFRDREAMGVFREGTNEVETTVLIKASRSLKYGDVVKIIDAVKLAGAQPVGLQIDDLSD
jgi:biopolymer transport protein ExbD